ncbi:hypothetical protein [Leucobacter triazinivorans]|uniref:Uncharacterized protein n=1 Tax=Leucobacter triazinivorans TaxID=1784719 RepID=A0A4P6KF90_9MICO|nr:hypothetical protein [Leucobacter triazinivorans]QBE49135.1 hypothetical protein EVS81_10000 [Leucobacter triazinivorans]
MKSRTWKPISRRLARVSAASPWAPFASMIRLSLADRRLGVSFPGRRLSRDRVRQQFEVTAVADCLAAVARRAGE